jgi:hypothetical protein
MARVRTDRAAIPVDRTIERFGATVLVMGPRMRCTVCGKLGAAFTLPSWGMSEGYKSVPRDKIAIGFARSCVEVC